MEDIAGNRCPMDRRWLVGLDKDQAESGVRVDVMHRSVRVSLAPPLDRLLERVEVQCCKGNQVRSSDSPAGCKRDQHDRANLANRAPNRTSRVSPGGEPSQDGGAGTLC